MITDIVILLVVHWIADFLLQPKEIAMYKSSDMGVLTQHVFLYTLAMGAAVVYSSVSYGGFFTNAESYPQFLETMAFLFVTFAIHWLTDFITSKWLASLYKKGKYYGFPGFFPVLGLDQLLHQLQLIYTYYFLTQIF